MACYQICAKPLPERMLACGQLAPQEQNSKKFQSNRLVSQMRAPLAACREPAGKLWQLCKVLYVFEDKTQYLLIHAPFTRIVVFWHISNVPPMISLSQICF